MHKLIKKKNLHFFSSFLVNHLFLQQIHAWLFCGEAKSWKTLEKTGKKVLWFPACFDMFLEDPHLPNGMTWGHLNRLQAEAAVSAGEAALKAFRSAGGWRCGFKCWNPFDVLNPSWIEYQWCLMMMDRIDIDVLMSLKDFPSFLFQCEKEHKTWWNTWRLSFPLCFLKAQ